MNIRLANKSLEDQRVDLQGREGDPGKVKEEKQHNLGSPDASVCSRPY